jgi:uncharacterized protein (TIGR02996 family)
VSDAESDLHAALAALASDDDERALEHLVAAWQAARAAAIAPLVDVLASRIEPRAKALGGKTARERYEAFRATALQHRQADLGRLVALLPKLAYGDVETALDTLLYHWRPTPRMRALLEPIQLPGYTDRLNELRSVHATPRDTPVSARARELLARLERELGNDPAGDQLLAQVYADPDADAPRLVYADWATARGDPRGELITLQFARRQRKPDKVAVRREKELLELYTQRWLAPIWSALRPDTVRFDRGFLASATIEPFAAIAARPEWATVVAVELVYQRMLPLAAFPALRELRNVTPPLLPEIAKQPTQLVHLGLAEELDATVMPAKFYELRDGDAFPCLRSLGVWGLPEDWAWLWDTPIGARIERLEMLPVRLESPWLRAPQPPQLRTLCICHGRNELQLERTDSGWTALRIVCRDAARDVPAWASLVLYQIPPRTLRTATCVMPFRPKQRTVDAIERALRAQHPALERFTLDVDPFI